MKDSPPLVALKKLVYELGYRKAGAQIKAAPGYLADVISGRRPLSEELALKLGYVKKVTWIKIKLKKEQSFVD